MLPPDDPDALHKRVRLRRLSLPVYYAAGLRVLGCLRRYSDAAVSERPPISSQQPIEGNALAEPGVRFLGVGRLLLLAGSCTVRGDENA